MHNLYTKAKKLLITHPIELVEVILGLSLTLVTLKVADEGSIPSTTIHHALVNLSVLSGTILVVGGTSRIIA